MVGIRWAPSLPSDVTGGTLQNADNDCFELVPDGSNYLDFEARLQTAAGAPYVDMSAAIYAHVDITNFGTVDTWAWLRIGDRNNSPAEKEWQRQGLVLKAGESIAFEFSLPRHAAWDYSLQRYLITSYPHRDLDTYYGSLRGAPPHFTSDWGSNFEVSDLQTVNQVYVRIGEPVTNDAPSSLRFCHPRYTVWNAHPLELHATDYTPARTAATSIDVNNFFPWIDVFGQRMYDTWPGRVTSHADFPAHKAEEIAWMSSKPGPQNLSEYGGYVPAGSYNATGHFRTQKIGDKHWFIDPLGYPFFSVGIAGMGNNGGTTTNLLFGVNRAVWQERCSSVSSGVPAGMTGNCGQHTQIDYWDEAIAYKHGFMDVNNPQDYDTSLMDTSTTQGYANAALYNEFIIARMKKWGVNTQGAWSVEALNAAKIGASYASQIGGIEEGMRTAYCFFINTGSKEAFAWTDAGIIGNNDVSTIQASVEAIIDDKLALINPLLDQHVQTGMTLDSDPYCIGVFIDNEIQNQDSTPIQWNRYFEAVRNAMRVKLPNKLYLCNRWAGSDVHADVQMSVNYCDVVSYNWYHNEVNEYDNPFPSLAHMNFASRQTFISQIDGKEKPVLIGEFTISTFDGAQVASGARHATTDRQRGRISAHYWKSCLNTNNVVGALFFRWADQYITGRGDGESFQNGFVTLLDHPYYEFLDEVMKFTYSMYEADFGPA